MSLATLLVYTASALYPSLLHFSFHPSKMKPTQFFLHVYKLSSAAHFKPFTLCTLFEISENLQFNRNDQIYAGTFR